MHGIESARMNEMYGNESEFGALVFELSIRVHCVLVEILSFLN